ncbi:MAG: hypothetical protein GY710_06375 [Desulfobacteraceae bacterium]|nr:hypothetical protein [Desulfobacteraceae bacterium]
MPTCIEEVAKKTGLSEKEVAEIVEVVEAKREGYIASGAVDDPKAFLDNEITKLAYQERNAKLRQKFDAYNNVIKSAEIKRGLQDVIDTAPKKGILLKTKPIKEGWQALFFGTHLKVKGGRSSIQSLRNGVFNDWANSFMGESNKAVQGVRKLLKSKDFNDDIIREIREPLSTKNNEARKIGKIISKYSEIVRDALNREGAQIGKVEGWTPQTHDRFRMHKATEDVWVKDQLGYLDLKETFPGLTRDESERILRRVYTEIVTGVSDVKEIPSFSAPKNLATKIAKNRVFQYKDADSVIAYNTKYGRGTIFESVMTHMNRSSRNYALMNKLGTNPEYMVKKLLQEQRQELKNLPESKKLLSQIEGDFDKREGTVGVSFAEASGETMNPVNLTSAQVMSGVRAWQSMAKLGQATLSATADIYINAMNIRYRGQNMFEAWNEAFRQYTVGLGSKEIKEVAHAMGYGYDGMISSIMNRFDPDAGQPGRMSSAMDVFFKASGLNLITETGQMGASHQLSGRLAYLKRKSFNNLGQMGEVLKLHGLDANDWAVLKRSTRKINKKEFMLADEIMNVSDDVIERTIAKDKIKISEAARKKDISNINKQIQSEKKKLLRGGSKENLIKIEELQERLKNVSLNKKEIIEESKKDLRRRYFAFVADEIDTSIIASDDRTRAAMLQGTKPGTVKGELLRSMAQFKAFPWTFQQRFLKSQRWNNKGVNQSDKAGVSFLIANSLVFGYAAMTLKDLAKGNTPRDPNKPETWLKAALQGGGAGFYGDFIFSKHNRFGGGLVDSLAGPVVGTAANAVNLFQDLYRGDAKAADAIYTGLNNTPYINLWYSRALLDYTLLNHVRDAVSPGSRKRQEKRYNKEFGGRRWFDKIQN